MIAGALIGCLQTDLFALGIDRETLAGGTSTPIDVPVLAPKGPQMPDTSWRTRAVAQISDEGLTPYLPASPSASGVPQGASSS
jgi:hypothetical protein